MKRFSRYWDILYNSGNFSSSVRLLWPEGDVFGGFSAFSDWIYNRTAATWKIAQERMARLLFDYLTEQKGVPAERVGTAMAADLSKMRGKQIPPFLHPYLDSSARAVLTGRSATKRQTLRQ